MSNMDKNLTRAQRLEKELKLIESVLEDHAVEHDEGYRLAWVESSLRFCIKEMRELLDENDSVWAMIDEIRAADIANHSEEFRQKMDRKLAEIKILAAMKPGLA